MAPRDVAGPPARHAARVARWRRTTLVGPACALLLLVAAPGAMAAPGAPTRAAPGQDQLSLSATPAALEILAAPCGPRTVDVGVRNDSADPVYADVLLSPDAPLTISPDLLSSYLPPGYELVVPVKISAPVGTAGGEYEVLLEAGRTGHGDRLVVPVSVDPPPTGPGANLALGGTVTASSSHASFSACGAADGNADQEDWELVTGWNDGTPAAFPDWLAVEFAAPETVSRVDVHTLNSSRYPVTRFGLSDWDVQVLDAGTWRTVATVRGNTTGTVSSTFDPVTAAGVRVLALASHDARYSRLVELEVYAEPGVAARSGR